MILGKKLLVIWQNQDSVKQTVQAIAIPAEREVEDGLFLV